MKSVPNSPAVCSSELSPEAARPGDPKRRKGDWVEACALHSLVCVAVTYRVEEVFLSLGRDYRILDAQDQLAYFVDGKVLSPVRRLSFQDAHGAELYLMRDKFLALRARFEIVRDGNVVAAVRRRFWNIAWVKHRVSLSDGETLETRRARAGGECLCRADVAVTRIAPDPTASRFFEVQIHPDEDQVLLLAVLIAIRDCQRSAERSSSP